MAYEISVNIQIKENNNILIGDDPIQFAQGSFNMNISSSTASSIDQCEKALLDVNHVALRDALSSHLTQLSKKEAKSNGLPGFVKKTIHDTKLKEK